VALTSVLCISYSLTKAQPTAMHYPVNILIMDYDILNTTMFVIRVEVCPEDGGRKLLRDVTSKLHGVNSGRRAAYILRMRVFRGETNRKFLRIRQCLPRRLRQQVPSKRLYLSTILYYPATLPKYFTYVLGSTKFAFNLTTCSAHE
jgi:hypothetical protein